MKPLTKDEREALIAGLQMRMCFIETGSPYLRARDVAAGHTGGAIQALSPCQMELLLVHERLVREITNGLVKRVSE